MPKITAQIQWASNVDQLKASIREGTGSVVAMKDAVDRTARSLGGEGLLRAANNTTAAIAQLGGVSKLTAAEKERVNTQLTKAIEKYTLLGQKAPPAMLEIEQATRRVEAPTDALTAKSVALGAAIGTAIGQFAYNAVTRLASSMGTLILEGARMASTVDSFDRLATSIGESSDAMLGATRTATKGLIADLDIIQASNKAMLLGLPVTAKEMGTLGAAAVTLGKAMGQDATKSMDDLITALGRSSPMILDNLGLTVKVGEANEAYARSIGKTTSQLTDAEKKTAFYQAAMAAAEQKVAALGGVQLTLLDQGTRLSTSFTNQAHAAGNFANTALKPLVALMSALPEPVLNTGVALTTLVGVLTAAKIGTVAATAAFAAGGPAAGAMAVATGALSGSVGLLTGALSFLALTPMGLAITAAAALAAGVWYLKGRIDSTAPSVRGLGVGIAEIPPPTERLNEALLSVGGEGLPVFIDGANKGADAAKRLADEIAQNKQRMDENKASVQAMFAATPPLTRSMEELKDISEKLTKTAQDQIAANVAADKAAGQWRQTLNWLGEEYMRLERGLEAVYKTFLMLAPSIRDNSASLGAYDLIAEHSVVVAGQQSEAARKYNEELGRMGVLLDFTAHTSNNASQQVEQSIGKWGAFLDVFKKGATDLFSFDSILTGLAQGLWGPVGELFNKGMQKLVSVAFDGLKKVGGFFKELFGQSQGRKDLLEANEQIARLKDNLVATYGPLDRIRTLGNGAGAALADAWGSQNREGLAWLTQLAEQFTAEMNNGVTPAAQTFGDTMSGAANGAVGDLLGLGAAAAVIKDGIATPIIIPVRFAVEDFDFPEAGTSKGGVSFKPPTQSDIDTFMRNNPGDSHRIRQAFTNITDEQANAAGIFSFATGTHGQFQDFGAGTPAMLHGRERVVTEAEGRSDAGMVSALISEVRALRAEQASQRRALREDLFLAVRDGNQRRRAA